VESVYLKTLVEVVRTGSISRAAEVLCITQPAVSRRIKVLEEQYGHPLLDRSGHAFRPTEAGRVVCEKAERLLELEADLIADLHVLGGRTRVSFCSTPSFGIAHLPAILKDFMLTCAETVDLDFAVDVPPRIIDGLTEGLFDVAVMENCDCFDLSTFASFPLPNAETLFVSAPSLGIPAGEAGFDVLCDLPLFIRREGCCSRTLLDNNLKAIGHDLREFRKFVVVDDLHLIIRAVLDGEAIAFLSPDVVSEALAAGRLRTHVVRGFQHVRQRAVVVTPAGCGDGPVAEFVKAVLRHFDLPLPAGAGGARRDPGEPVSLPAAAPALRAAGRPAGPRSGQGRSLAARKAAVRPSR
jgi:LysR family transcriptional regulator, transcriptional activator of the cysJI operon